MPSASLMTCRNVAVAPAWSPYRACSLPMVVSLPALRNRASSPVAAVSWMAATAFSSTALCSADIGDAGLFASGGTLGAAGVGFLAFVCPAVAPAPPQSPAPAARPTATTTAVSTLSLVRNMAFSTSRVSAVTAADATGWTVAARHRGGEQVSRDRRRAVAGQDHGQPAGRQRDSATGEPLRQHRPRAAASRLATVPPGQPSCRATCLAGPPLQIAQDDRQSVAGPAGGSAPRPAGAAGRPAGSPGSTAGWTDLGQRRFPRPPPGGRASALQGRLVGDPVQPVPQPLPRDDGGRLAGQDEEGGLEGVLGVVVAEHAAADAQHHRPVPADQRLRRRPRRGCERRPRAGRRRSPGRRPPGAGSPRSVGRSWDKLRGYRVLVGGGPARQ